MKKRMFGLFMAVVMTVMSLSVCAVLPAAADSDVTFTVATVEGSVGDVVEVPVSVSANSYLVNADMFLTYDPDVLEPVMTQYTDGAGDENCYQVNTAMFGNGWMYLGAVKEPGTFKMVVATGSTTGIIGGGEMFRVAFKILSADADNAQIVFSADPIYGNDGSGETGADGFASDYVIHYTASNGVVTVKGNASALAGDLNGDGELDIVDSLLLFAAVCGRRNLTDAQKLVADFNGDGKINTVDSVLLFRRVSGY